MGRNFEGSTSRTARAMCLTRARCDQASDEQADRLGAVFGGQLGGPMVALAPLRKENGERARLVGIFHPAGEDFAIAKATRSRISASGIEFALEGRLAFASAFSWAA